jgi:CSLREA domain-containing protein
LTAGIRALFLVPALAAGLIFTAVAGAAPFVVTKTADTNDGHCNADCSLREAIGAANGGIGHDTVKLKAKTYKLTIEGNNGNNEGDLDIGADVTIKGAGARKTTIAGAWKAVPDRLLEMPFDGTSLSILGLRLKDGDAGGGSAGAVFVPGSSNTLNLSRARVASNEASFTGGIESNGDSTLTKVTFSHNHADQCCGAFYNRGTAKLTDVTFDHNDAGTDTGAMYDEGTSAILKNVTFVDNQAGFIGGAFISHADGTKLTNVTFSGNHADGDGGAFYGENPSTSVLNNVTITDNETEGDGGGIYANSSASITLNNSIVAGNRDLGDGSAPDCAGDPLTSDGYLLIGDETGCTHDPITGLLTGDPMLKPLDDNGGFTKTHALKGSSPAKNAGNPAAPGSTPEACATKDQRGVKRPQQDRCDLGAYELK